MSSHWDWNWVPPRNHTMHGFLLQNGRQSYSSDTFATQQQKEVVGGGYHAPGNLTPWKFQNPLYRRQNGPPLTQNKVIMWWFYKFQTKFDFFEWQKHRWRHNDNFNFTRAEYKLDITIHSELLQLEYSQN